MTTAADIEAIAADLGLTLESEFVPFSKSRNASEKQPSLNWKVTLKRNGRPILTTDYMAGSGHCPAYKQGDRSIARVDAVKAECELGLTCRIDAGGYPISMRSKPILPNFADVLHSLASDADVIDAGGFEEWAGNLGYDTDSRKAEATYRACLDIALKLRSGLGDDGLAKLREATQDY